MPRPIGSMFSSRQTVNDPPAADSHRYCSSSLCWEGGREGGERRGERGGEREGGQGEGSVREREREQKEQRRGERQRSKFISTIYQKMGNQVLLQVAKSSTGTQ